MGTLNPDGYVQRDGKVNFFSMQQYRNLFRSQRLPGKYQDKQDCRFETYDEERQRIGSNTYKPYVIVSRKGRFFKLFTIADEQLSSTCRNAHNRSLQPAELVKHLNEIVKITDQDLDRDDGKYNPGWLTALPRTRWWHTRQLLQRHSEINAASLDAIADALVLINLESSYCQSTLTDEAGHLKEVSIARDSANRWYDKNVSFTVFEDGLVGGTMEHSLQDAVPLIRMNEHIFAYQTSLLKKCDKIFLEACNKNSLFPFEELKWDIPESIDYHSSLQDAKSIVREVYNDWSVCCQRIHIVGKSKLKNIYKISPDSFVQIAMQLAYYRLHNFVPSTYESIATLQFNLGRTETGRSVSSISKVFVKSMDDISIKSCAKKRSLLRKAMLHHSQMCHNASKGYGIDRHLFCLTVAHSQMRKANPNIEVISLLESPVMKRASSWMLSTSHVTCPNACLGPVSFHEVSKESTGIVYGIEADAIFVTAMTSQSYPKTNSGLFISALETAIKDMIDLLDSSGDQVSKNSRLISNL